MATRMIAMSTDRPSLVRALWRCGDFGGPALTRPSSRGIAPRVTLSLRFDGNRRSGWLYFLTSSTTALRRGLQMPHSLTAAVPPEARQAIEAAHHAHYGVLGEVGAQRLRIPHPGRPP